MPSGFPEAFWLVSECFRRHLGNLWYELFAELPKLWANL